MYKIFGANQVEYGPVTADQLRAWIAEGRINAQTPVQLEGDPTWRPLSTYPEFASALPPAPAAAPAAFSAQAIDDGRARALSMVNGPSIALIISSSLYILFNIAYAIFLIVVMNGGGGLNRMNRFNSASQDPAAFHMAQVFVAGIFCFAILLGILMLFGALKMRKLENYGLCMGACIAAMLPCSYCCILSLGFGIWGLVVLNNAEVKQHFR